MIKFIVPVHNQAVFNNYTAVSIKQYNLPTCVIQDNLKIHQTIFQKYNKGIKALQSNENAKINYDDIIVFMHEDVKILDPCLVEKLSTTFVKKPDIGLIGIVGTDILYDHCVWHLDSDRCFNKNTEHLYGHLIQENNGEQFHSVFGNNIGFFDKICMVDGFFMAVRGSLINDGLMFDEKSYSGYDFYDADLCMQVLQMGYKIGIIDILTQHRSSGSGINKPEWMVAKHVFQQKWKHVGFPITQISFSSCIKKKSDITVIEI
jgi:GT2 family glycosyltransferase